ncbi:J domain-containing protein [Brevundimonas subvibrioides]|uniref:Heat shock protein DnaJ domain protein n=1 Tax=Brevundimonas subvibrioides (strain ATCC 15264 / DSM 4735 / LMG 14903 / NBRC 16000 / CB 81) TaxID=633149 RepID=D9QGS4_BRESC|nr:molecular chaperone DnaJ [Brevundimonas subvibrioides]ADL00890.1 heat shock protein DnaJ domain protein [Brevundimonas subvibrioides ATCC 15264]
MSLIWLVLAGIVVWALIRLGRQTEGPRRGHWRVAATLVSAALLVGGVLALTKGAWVSGAGLVGAALWLVVASRMRTAAVKREAIGDAEARSILGVGTGASPEQVNAAWRRLMGRAHPDQGGTEGLAAKLNAARDRLLKK